MSTYLSLGRGASLVCPPTPREGQGASLVGQPTPVYFLTYLLRCYLGAKLVYPPTPVKAPVLSSYIHLPQFRPRCFAPMSTYLSLG